MKKIYLDLCVYNRPFDFQGDERIEIETNAFIYILEMIEKGIFGLIVSEALSYENEMNPNEQRKRRISSFFGLAKKNILTEDSDLQRVRLLKKYGLSDMDGLHIAIAERAKVDYFITCDDAIIRAYRRNAVNIKVHIVSLEEFLSLEVH